MSYRYLPVENTNLSYFINKDINSFRDECGKDWYNLKSFLKEYKDELNRGNFYYLFRKWNTSDFLYSAIVLAHFFYLCGINFAENMTWNQISGCFPSYLDRFEENED